MPPSSSSSANASSANASASSYLGPNGYTIYKECLDIKEQRLIREELNVKPYIPKAPVQPPAYPVFRESNTKFYLPRFYGVKNYGEPDENRLPPGEDINVTFAGELRDYQQNIVNIYMYGGKPPGGKPPGGKPPTPSFQNSKSTTLVHAASAGGVPGACPRGVLVACPRGGLLEIPCGRGKTVIALKIISELRKKTLVIVHKSFLLNQWVERIEQFLPQAKVGRIQGQIIDIDGKDIVIGMLQSLSMKEYPETLFHVFGLTIVDECHHISSEVFCRSLQKIITYNTLGLSATMQRKDGLTKVFKMFLGEIVYSEERDTSDPVLVKAIQYITDDAEFNEMCYDYRGNPAYSTMISKLCAFNPRSEFILQVLTNELQLAKKQNLTIQVMILAHNRNLLTYLHDAITHRQLATTGYYVGGMKEVDLKKTESCQVIIATYAMAAEALDIKTLTTLFLATPKTDVIQAVGRILRVKHERPMVVDFIDSHEVFLSQWAKRRKYYESNSYTIMHTNSHLYASDKWTTTTTKKKEKVSKVKKVSAVTCSAVTCSAVTCSAVTCRANLLSNGVAAAARFINTIVLDEAEASEAETSEAAEASEAETIDYEEENKKNVFKLRGKCFI